MSVNSPADTAVKVLAINHFSAFLRSFAPGIIASNINRSVIVEFLSYLSSKKLAVNSRRSYICGLGIFLDLCHQNQWADIKTSGLIYRGDIPKLQKCQPRYIPKEVVDQLNQYLDDLPPYILRLVLVLEETGRRVNEVCTLRFNCLIQDGQGDWFLRHYQSKMKKENSIPISQELATVILSQQEFVKSEWGLNCPFLFPQPKEWCKRKGVWRKGKPIYQSTINKLLNQLAIEKNICDLSGKVWHFQSHQFRHTVGTTMINNGVTIHIVQRYLGHETFEMTMRYVHIFDQTLKEEFAKFKNKMVDVTGELVDYERVVADIAFGSDPNSVDARRAEKKYSLSSIT